MRPLRTFKVTPFLPQALEPLQELAYNLHFSWNLETWTLFRRMDPELWEALSHNPVALLGQIRQERLNELVEDQGFLAQMERASQQLRAYLKERVTWYSRRRARQGECFAYFSMEFGLAECLPIYSGGLGILAGDHLKAASDLGLPLVGVGLLYQKGYFRQYLNSDGWQQERYPINDFYTLPLTLMQHPDGSEIRIEVDYPGRKICARIWRAQVGVVPLYLLDTNIPVNSQYDQDICDELYGGDEDLRIHQEIMLGIGGIRALRALGIAPTAFHMNEGHSAFLSLERIRLLMQEEQLGFAEALQVAKASQIFTTHTPVPAGIDLFPANKIDHYLGSYYGLFGLKREQFLALGRENTGDFSAPFSMAVLAINTASFVNGVSKLHGVVSRKMFGGLWAGIPLDEVPITSVTNGVHPRTWVGEDNQFLYDRYLGSSWSEASSNSALWQRVEQIPDGELWRTHERCRARLVNFARRRLQQQLSQRGAATVEQQQALEVLQPEILTIGFARRFATYKRATLLLRDPERLLRILNHPAHPVQILFAGKAHPRDNPGKELIRQVVQFARQPEARRRVVFLEDYDMFVTGLMVAGVDVWLNTPLRPREASGTSGMKAAMNGGQNLSILDGWWDEADYHGTGWPIGRGEDYNDRKLQDEVESNALYDLLEQEIIPAFYAHDKDDLPRQWIQRMKRSICSNLPHFSTIRMLQEYAERAYLPVSDHFARMRLDGYAPAKALTQWQNRLLEHWYGIQVARVDVKDAQGQPVPPSNADFRPVMRAGETLTVSVHLHLGQLKPGDVLVQAYQGLVNEANEIPQGAIVPMAHLGQEGEATIYQGEVRYGSSGLQGLGLRILPFHPDLWDAYEPRLIHWA